MPKDVVFNESVVTLKQVIPLMMKYSVPVLPNNYALWYTYVVNSKPELNKEIDSLLVEKNQVSSHQVDSLYEKHLQADQHHASQALTKSMEDFAGSISKSIGFTQEDTQKFEQAMDTVHSELNGMDSDAVEVDQISDFVDDLISQSLQMRDNAKGFSESLNHAQEEIKRLREKLEYTRQEALRDELTGALNRRAFNETVARLIDMENQDCALILCDIDHFKKFNDTHGHQLGDQVLKVVAARLSKYSNVKASTYRYGGEEFAILVEENASKMAAPLAEQLRQSIERLVIKDKKSQKQVAKITCSFGIAQYALGFSNFTWIELADERLYRAKEAGRNRVMAK